MQKAHEQRGITLADVARQAGYSRSTASLVFQESPLVAAKTRVKVLAAAEELGYVYDRRAASLRMRRSHSVGLLVGGLSNPFFAELVEAIEEGLGPSGYRVLLGNSSEDPHKQDELLKTLLEYRIDGLLAVPAIGSTKASLLPPAQLGVPVVVLTRKLQGFSAPYVGSDDRTGGELAAGHLLDHGCTNLAYFGGPEHVRVREERRQGFEAAVRGAGASINPDWSVSSKTSSTAGYETAVRLLGETRLPDGIVCHSDAVAFGLMRALRDAEIDVGMQTRVIGWDDVEHARTWSPSLSSIAVGARHMGIEAAHLLIRLINGEADGNPNIVFGPELKARESCGCGVR